MKHFKCLWVFVFVMIVCFLACGAQTAVAKIVQDPQSVVDLTLQSNFDTRSLAERLTQTQAIVEGIHGGFFPFLSAQTSYYDSRKRPFNPLEPARTRNIHWAVRVTEMTPWHTDVSLSLSTDHTRLFRSEVPNPALPLPASVHSPVLSLDLEVDLMKDFLGYIRYRQWDQAKLNYAITQDESALLNHRLALTAQSLYWAYAAITEMRDTAAHMVRLLKRLASDVESMVARHIAEKSDLYKLRSVIAQRHAYIQVLDNQAGDVLKALREISAQPDLTLQPAQPIAAYAETLAACETRLVSGANLDTTLASQIDISHKRVQAARLEYEIEKRKGLPDLKLIGSIGMTGTGRTFGASMGQVWSFDHPVYAVGLQLTMPLSPSIGTAAKRIGEAGIRVAEIENEKLAHEFDVTLSQFRGKIQTQKSRYDDMVKAVEYAKKEVSSLMTQYKQGRILLYQYIQEENFYLETRIQQIQAASERVGVMAAFLTRFDRFDCPAMPSAGARGAL